MQTIGDYVAAAVARNGLQGAKGLSLKLGLSQSMVGRYVRGQALPDHHTMVQLADLAGADLKTALRHWAIWHVQRLGPAGDARQVRRWLSAADVLTRLVLLFVILAGATQTERAGAGAGADIHYATFRRWLARLSVTFSQRFAC